MTTFSFSLDEINAAARKLIDAAPFKVIVFNGDMGVGKTTFIKALCLELGVKDATASPTFSLVNEYSSETGEVMYHFDVYRLKSEEEAYDFGIEDYLYSGNYCFIEWAEKIPNLIPPNHTTVNLRILADGRRELELT